MNELRIKDWKQSENESGFNVVRFTFIASSRLKHEIIITETNTGCKFNNWNENVDDLDRGEYGALEEFIHAASNFAHNFNH